MIIKVRNKVHLEIDDFKFKCCIGKNGFKLKKNEGDKSTPKGTFSLGTLYYRADKVSKPITKLKLKKITKNLGWCNDPLNKKYNSEIKIKNKIKCEKLFRKDFKYDYLIVINYNTNKIIQGTGSAIFFHLTKNYKPTLRCIAIGKKDFLILLKILKKNTKIKIG